MQETVASPAPGVGDILLSPYAADRLLRLRLMLDQRRAAEQMLHGPALSSARALLPQAIFSLYLDCIEAGVGEDARRMLAAVPHTTPPATASEHSAQPDRLSLASGRPA